jgi:very-short-patch-repair endonuclease
MKRPPGRDMRQRPRRLRHKSTEAEQLLWGHLRNRRLAGYKFRRQMWLCGFIADFACPEAKLVIEADGGQHADRIEEDARRSAAFVSEGYRTLRFWNHEILGNIDGVLQSIHDALAPASRNQFPLPSGEREGPTVRSSVGG